MMKKNLITVFMMITMLTALSGCGDEIGKKAEEAWQDAQEKIMESVKAEINDKIQEIMEENQVEIPEDFNFEDFNIEELADATGLDFSTLENMEKIDLGELDLSQLEELLEQLLSVDFEAIESNLAE